MHKRPLDGPAYLPGPLSFSFFSLSCPYALPLLAGSSTSTSTSAGAAGVTGTGSAAAAGGASACLGALGFFGFFGFLGFAASSCVAAGVRTTGSVTGWSTATGAGAGAGDAGVGGAGVGAGAGAAGGLGAAARGDDGVVGAGGADTTAAGRDVCETTDVRTTGRAAAAGAAGRGFTTRLITAGFDGAAGATRITGTCLSDGAATDGAFASGTASVRTSFGNVIAPAPPSTTSATVSARANISLMQPPLPAENSPRVSIGTYFGN